MTEEEQKTIEKVRKDLGKSFCRRCGYCLPCSVGINITGVLLMEGYYNRYDLKEWAINRYAAMEHKASECIGCGACEPRCPYQLPIREMMEKAVEIFGE